MSRQWVQFEQIVALASDAILVLDHQGVIRYANAAAARLFGRPTEALLEQVFGFVVIPDEPTEIEVARAGGEITSADMRSVDMEMDGQRMSVAYLRDVSERKLAAGALQAANTRLEEAQRIARLGYWEWQPQTRRLSWSQMVFEIFGRDPNTYTPTHEDYYSAVHPADRSPCRPPNSRPSSPANWITSIASFDPTAPCAGFVRWRG